LIKRVTGSMKNLQGWLSAKKKGPQPNAIALPV